jgi:hypothetical protein
VRRVKIELAIASTSKVPDLLFHGTKKKFTKFSEYRPAFFSASIDYAKEYGHIIMKAHVDIKRLFDTRTDKRAVEIYNTYFVPHELNTRKAKPIKLGDPVHMNFADELWAYLSVPEYPAPHYDGIAVYESNLHAIHERFKDAEIAYVPMDVSQIHLK